MKLILHPICGILLSLVVYSDAINVWGDFDVEENRILGRCIAQDGTQESLDALQRCQGPPVFNAMFNYCVQMVFQTLNIADVINAVKEDPCLSDKGYYCFNEKIRSLTCYEKTVEMGSLVECYRAIVKRFCPNGVNIKPVCNDPQVLPAPGSDADCCFDKCIYDKKNHYYKKYYKKEDYSSHDYQKKNDYSKNYKDDYGMGYPKKDYKKYNSLVDIFYSPNKVSKANEGDQAVGSKEEFAAAPAAAEEAA